MQKTSTWIGEVPGTTYGLSDNGWIDMVLFKKWFFHQWIKLIIVITLRWPYVVPHYNLEAVKIARKNDVIISTLVPQTTHEMQPLDITVFGSFKNSWVVSKHVGYTLSIPRLY